MRYVFLCLMSLVFLVVFGGSVYAMKNIYANSNDFFGYHAVFFRCVVWRYVI